MRFIQYITVIFVMFLSFYTNASANINGIRIEIVEAKMYGKVHIPLVDKRINTRKDMFRLGYLQAGRSTKSLINEDEFYIITLQDKFSSGKLNAIIKGRYLKKYQHNVGVLTQVAFLLSEDLIGENYDRSALENNLNMIAKKIIRNKGFVLDGDLEIGYTDILLYENGGRELYKSYDEDVKPLEKKIKKNTLVYDDAYSFVYESSERKKVLRPKHDEVKKLAPLYRLVVFLHIPRNTKSGTEIVKLKKLREGTAKVDGFELSNSNVPFRISSDGRVVISSILREEVYSFEAIAHTQDGDSNKIDFTIIIDEMKDTKYYKIK